MPNETKVGSLQRFVNYMEAPFRYRGVTDIDIFEGFTRHPPLRRNIRVKGKKKTYQDMVLIDELGFFQRFGIEELAGSFGITDSHDLRNFLGSRWSDTDFKKTMLLADFRAYVKYARERLSAMYPILNGQKASLPYLAVHGVTPPDYLAGRGDIPIDALQAVFSAINKDIKETGFLPNRGEVGVVNRHYRNLVALEELGDSETFIPKAEAERRISSHLPEKSLNHYAEQGDIETREKGGETFYRLRDIQKMVRALMNASVMKVTERAIRRDLEKIISSEKLRQWEERGQVRYTIFVSQPKLKYADPEQLDEIMTKLGHIGIRVMEPAAEISLVESTRTEKEVEKRRQNDDLFFYFDSIKDCKPLKRAEERELGFMMVDARNWFTYLVLRNPYSAYAIAKKMRKAVETIKSGQRQTFFTGDLEKAKAKAAEIGFFEENVKKKYDRAKALEARIKETREKGNKLNGLLGRYSKIQSECENLFRNYGFQIRTLEKFAARHIQDKFCAARHIHDRFCIPELDMRDTTQRAYQLFRDTKDELVKAVIKLGIFWAKKYAHRRRLSRDKREKMLWAISDASVGLLKAIDRFDPGKGFKLGTYASWWCMQSIKRATSLDRHIRLPMHVIPEIGEYSAVRKSFFKEHFREPDVDEIAEIMKIDVESVKRIRRAARGVISLNYMIGDDEETELGDFIGQEDEHMTTNLSEMDKEDIWDHLRQALSPREFRILWKRYKEGKTLEMTGSSERVTRERVRQIQGIAERKLGHPINSRKLEGLLDDPDESPFRHVAGLF
jgi:RNA polymerase sigma factor (sigma-70 family)